MAHSARASRGNVPPARPVAATPHSHVIKPGDTPSVIARKYGLKVAALMAANPRLDERRLRIKGKRLKIALLRPGQELILAAVETAVANREHLLLQATTGIGKTVAALYPALRYCLAHDKRLFVLTAKTMQQNMATAVLQLLNQDAAFRSLRWGGPRPTERPRG